MKNKWTWNYILFTSLRSYLLIRLFNTSHYKLTRPRDTINFMYAYRAHKNPTKKEKL